MATPLTRGLQIGAGAYGEQPWDAWMNGNLQTVDDLLRIPSDAQMTASSFTAAPPSSPTNGFTVLITDTGGLRIYDNSIAGWRSYATVGKGFLSVTSSGNVWVNTGTAWIIDPALALATAANTAASNALSIAQQAQGDNEKPIFTAASQAAMLAATGLTVGTVCKRTDALATGGQRNYQLRTLPSATLANWEETGLLKSGADVIIQASENYQNDYYLGTTAGTGAAYTLSTTARNPNEMLSFTPHVTNSAAATVAITSQSGTVTLTLQDEAGTALTASTLTAGKVYSAVMVGAALRVMTKAANGSTILLASGTANGLPYRAVQHSDGTIQIVGGYTVTTPNVPVTVTLPIMLNTTNYHVSLMKNFVNTGPVEGNPDVTSRTTTSFVAHYHQVNIGGFTYQLTTMN